MSALFKDLLCVSKTTRKTKITCHCEERSDVAIRPPSTNLCQNHNNSLPNFVHLSKIWKFRRKRLRRGQRSAIF